MFKAIWLSKENELSLRTYNEKRKPEKGEVLVEVKYSGVNPADIKHGYIGCNDCVAGYDYAGTIVSLGPGMDAKFKIGDQVCGFAAPLMNKPPQYGAHQDYHIARHFIHKIPSNVPLADASTMPVIVQTAADGLFNRLGLTLGSTEKKPILIWGGAGSVGLAAIQLAKASGCSPIFTTASSKNHATLLELGADRCFDYHDSDVEAQISTALSSTGSKFPCIFDTVVAALTFSSPSSTVICESLASPDARFASVIPAIEPKREWSMVFACHNVDTEFVLPNGHRREEKANLEWQEKMDEAFVWVLENYGRRFVMPNVKVVKGGEEGIQALELSASGKASFEKFTVEHPL